MTGKYFIPLLVFCFLGLSAFSQDSFSLYESDNLSVYGYQGMDTSFLLDQLHYTSFLHSETVFNSGPSSLDRMLSRTLEEIYLEISDLLDIHDYNGHITVYVLPGREELQARASALSQDLSGASAFHSGTDVYISLDALTLSRFSDELSQVLIENYFAVPPPATVRQALCGYVQYHVKQMTDKELP